MDCVKKEDNLHWSEKGSSCIFFHIPEACSSDGVLHLKIQPLNEVEVTITHTISVSSPKTLIQFMPETGFIYCNDIAL